MEETKLRFNKGDRVRYCGSNEPYDKEGVVQGFNTKTELYVVAFENYFNPLRQSNEYECAEGNLVLVSWASANQHYETSVQPIEFMQANMAPEEFVGFLKGNIIKYAGRCGRKDEPLKEAKKIKQYAGWLVDALEGRTVDPRA